MLEDGDEPIGHRVFVTATDAGNHVTLGNISWRYIIGVFAVRELFSPRNPE